MKEKRKSGYEIADHGRRNAMQKIAVGLGALAGFSLLPETWTQPIVGRIVLPAHAATSSSTLHDPCTVELQSGDQTTATVLIKVTGFVTPPIARLPVQITATATGGANAQLTTQSTTSEEGTFEALMTIDGGPGITAVSVVTTATGAAGSASCSVNLDTAQALPALTPCTLSLAVNGGDLTSTHLAIVIDGSVNPATPNVPIHAVFATNKTSNFVPVKSPDFTTDGSGIIHEAFGEDFGPYCSDITVTLTSPMATGSTNCTLNIGTLPALMSCTLTLIGGGNQSDEFITLLIEGSVNPATPNVPIHAEFATNLAPSFPVPAANSDFTTNGSGIIHHGVG